MTVYRWTDDRDNQPSPAPQTLWSYDGSVWTYDEDRNEWSWPSGPGSSPLTDDITYLLWNGIIYAHGPVSDVSQAEAAAAPSQNWHPGEGRQS